MAQSEERSLLTMKSRVLIPTELNNTMQYALIPNYARRMELPLVAPPPWRRGQGTKKRKETTPIHVKLVFVRNIFQANWADIYGTFWYMVI